MYFLYLPCHLYRLVTQCRQLADASAHHVQVSGNRNNIFMETHEKYLDTYRVLVRTSWPVADSSSVTPCAHLRAARLGPSSPVRSS